MLALRHVAQAVAGLLRIEVESASLRIPPPGAECMVSELLEIGLDRHHAATDRMAGRSQYGRRRIRASVLMTLPGAIRISWW